MNLGPFPWSRLLDWFSWYGNLRALFLINLYLCPCLGFIFRWVLENENLFGWFENRLDMGIISTIMGVFGFGIGVTIGLVIGYFLFVYYQPTDVKVCFSFSTLLMFSVFWLWSHLVSWGTVYLENCCILPAYSMFMWIFVAWYQNWLLMFVSLDKYYWLLRWLLMALLFSCILSRKYFFLIYMFEWVVLWNNYPIGNSLC